VFWSLFFVILKVLKRVAFSFFSGSRYRRKIFKMSEKIIDGNDQNISLVFFSLSLSSFFLSFFATLSLSLGLSLLSLFTGNAIAAEIRSQLAQQISQMEQKPGLAVILVGSRTDSATYVRMKRKACLEVGIQNFSVDYDVNVTQDELLAKSKILHSFFVSFLI
jgi:hypothetical protein